MVNNKKSPDKIPGLVDQIRNMVNNKKSPDKIPGLVDQIRNMVNNKKSPDKIPGLVDQISPTNCVAELVDADSVNHIVVFLTGQVRALGTIFR